MKDLLQLLILVPLFILFYQFYSYTLTAKGEEKQKKCLATGVISMTAGITALAFHSMVTVFGGLILIMFGFRLIAKGLDRIDKHTFIDRYDDDNTPK